jgi:branched-chain amino acid aminotransferase
MNVFFIFGNTAITPDLESGTILSGVTRESVITLLKDQGIKVEERPLSIDEVIEAHRSGQLTEVFGTGTAATVSLIKELRYQEYVMKFDVDQWKTAPAVKSALNDIRYGRSRDVHNWMFKV